MSASNFSPVIWFVTGSQHLYGREAIQQVQANADAIVEGLNSSGSIRVSIVGKPVMTDPDSIRRLCLEANADPDCAGLIIWMHTFSPAKMWIGGLKNFAKPLCHFHTQYMRDLPWNQIDMGYMNLNQSAHGDREAGHLHTRLGLKRNVLVGHWTSEGVQNSLNNWARSASAWHDLQGAKFCRFGDNMRQVAVTEGDKVAAEITFGFSVEGFGVGDLVKVVDEISDAEVETMVRTLGERFEIAGDLDAIRSATRIYLGIKAFLLAGNFKGFTTTFEDLNGLDQLPGLAAQLLMEEGYGFGAEGDWKTAALLRWMKNVDGPDGSTSFMEDYTYHLDPSETLVLGAHMLEICPSIAATKPRMEVHPLGIGGKSDPARLVFDAKTGAAVNASLVDIGHRFRLVVNEVEAVDIPPMPNLPVARALWKCLPEFQTAATSWIYAGGAHHTGYSYSVTAEQLGYFAEFAGIEFIKISHGTTVESIRNQIRWNEAAFN